MDSPTVRNGASHNLRVRTKQLGLRIIILSGHLPRTAAGQVIAKQVVRSATSVGANYREAFRVRSQAEYISKLFVCSQELEETQFWLELLVESGMVKENRLKDLAGEANEIQAMITACIKTARRKTPSKAKQ